MSLHLRLVAIAASLAAVPSAMSQTVLTASSWAPPNHALTLSKKEWCDGVDKATSGRVKCNLLPKAVAPPAVTYDAVRDGLADVSFTVHGYTPGRFTLTQLAEFPFLGSSAEPVSIAYQRFFDRSPEMQAEHRGVKVLAVFTHGPGIIFNTKRAITKVEDVSGLRFRVGGGMGKEVAKALGMNTTLRPATDSGELLGSGAMDGTLFPAESVESFRIDKLIRFGTRFPGGLYNTSFVFMMNERKWASLSKQDQDAILSVSGENAAQLFGRNWDKVDRRAVAFMQASGVQFIQADAAFVKAVKDRTTSLEDAWAKAAEAKGMKDARKQLAAFRAEVARLER
jgi:TRAP-type C4-dicarboxylate transport system substrate-binding protein